MRKPTKFLELTDDEREHLERLWRESADFRVRQRAHALLLSSREFTVNQIAEIFDVNRDTVAAWIDSFGEFGDAGLADEPRRGAPPKLTEAERARAVELLKEHPHQPARVRAAIEAETGKSISDTTLARIARRAGLSWKRMRRSCKSRRDEGEFREAQAELGELARRHSRGEVDLFYFGESGFSCQPCVPYGWQEVGRTEEINSERSRRLNVPGFLGAGQEFEAYTRVGSVDTRTVVGCIDEFSPGLTGPTVLVLDNAPTHTSGELRKHVEKWAERGLELYYPPTYSPELNWIEILWRKVKYHWLPLAAYESFAALKASVIEILGEVGVSRFIDAESAAA